MFKTGLRARAEEGEDSAYSPPSYFSDVAASHWAAPSLFLPCRFAARMLPEYRSQSPTHIDPCTISSSS